MSEVGKAVRWLHSRTVNLMQQRADKTKAGTDQVRLPARLILRPPVSIEDLRTDTEYDPEGAEEFVALIRALRKESIRADV